MLDLNWIMNEQQQLPSEKVLPREIKDNLEFVTFPRFSTTRTPKKSFASRLTGSNDKKEINIESGDVLCATEMFGGNSMVFATDRNMIIGYDFKIRRQYSKLLKDSFVTCMEFYDHEGILITGHSNNIVNFIDPRNHKFKILRSFYDLTAFPPIQIKTIYGLKKLIIVNSVNEVILCERGSSKTVKFKSRGVIKANPTDIMTDVQVLEFSQGAIVALSGEKKVRLIWVSLNELFKVNILETIRRVETEPESLDQLQEKSSFSLENFSINKKTNFSLDFFGDNKRESVLEKQIRMQIPELIMLLKTKAKPAYGRSSIFLMSKNLWRSTGEKMFSVSIFGKDCEVSFSIIAGDGVVMKILTRKFSFDNNVIYAAILGIEMVLILFENLEFCFLHLDQFRKEESEPKSFGVLKKGSLAISEEGSGKETVDTETPSDKPNDLGNIFWIYLIMYWCCSSKFNRFKWKS
jgi:hypothetical protein